MQRKKLLKILRRWKVLFIRKQQSIYLGLFEISIAKLYLINQWKYLVQCTIFFSNVKNKRRFMSILRNVFTWRCHRSCHNPKNSNIRQPITGVSCVCHMLSTWSFRLTLLTFLVEQNIVHIINLNENQLVCSIGYFSILHTWKICNQIDLCLEKLEKKTLIDRYCLYRTIHPLCETSLVVYQLTTWFRYQKECSCPFTINFSYSLYRRTYQHITYSLQRLCTYYVR